MRMLPSSRESKLGPLGRDKSPGVGQVFDHSGGAPYSLVRPEQGALMIYGVFGGTPLRKCR